MLLQLAQEGGLAFFPGLTAPLSIETSQLPEQERTALENLVLRANLLTRPEAPAAAPSPARDARTYTLTVEEGATRRVFRFSDPVPADFRPLVRELLARSKLRDRGQGP